MGKYYLNYAKKVTVFGLYQCHISFQCSSFIAQLHGLCRFYPYSISLLHKASLMIQDSKVRNLFTPQKLLLQLAFLSTSIVF
jgi:hypothetical protein